MKIIAMVLMMVAYVAVVVAQRHQQSEVSRMNSTDEQRDSDQRKQSVREQPQFRLTTAGRGHTEDGKVTSFRSFESTDGVKIFTLSEFHESAEAVKKQLDVKLATFSEILDKSDRAVTGQERVVGKLIKPETGEEEFCIIRTSRKELSYARSSSLDHLLAFEAWLLNNTKKQDQR